MAIDRYQLVGVGLGALSVALRVGQALGDGVSVGPPVEFIASIIGACFAGYVLGSIVSAFVRRRQS